MADMAEMVVGELIAQSATVLVRGEASCRALHAWPGGAFGELLVHDAQTGAPVSGPPPGAKGHKRRPAGSTVVLLRLQPIGTATVELPPSVRSLPQTRPLPAQSPLQRSSGLLAAACRDELHLFREDDILGVLAD